MKERPPLIGSPIGARDGWEIIPVCDECTGRHRRRHGATSFAGLDHLGTLPIGSTSVTFAQRR